MPEIEVAHFPGRLTAVPSRRPWRTAISNRHGACTRHGRFVLPKTSQTVEQVVSDLSGRHLHHPPADRSLQERCRVLLGLLYPLVRRRSTAGHSVTVVIIRRLFGMAFAGFTGASCGRPKMSYASSTECPFGKPGAPLRRGHVIFVCGSWFRRSVPGLRR
jgi:hypothetical protein